MSDAMKSHEFVELVLRSLQGDITETEQQRFDQMLRTEPGAVRKYLELLELCVELSPQGSVNVYPAIESQTYDVLLQSMAEYEKTAPSVEIKSQPLVKHELIQKVEYPKTQHKISRLSIFSLFLSAAMFLFILYVKFGPAPKGVEVATLSESLNARWGSENSRVEPGARLVTGGDYLLREGSIELLFDNYARLVIEAPAEFQILLSDQVKLNYGMLFASVPREAIGFRVSSGNALIVDLGTEFGVKADFDGNTELHVIKGKTTLIAGEQTGKVGLEVVKGLAKKVSGINSAISDIPCNNRLFITSIDTRNNHAWRGPVSIDLADIVGGGNGLVPESKDNKVHKNRISALVKPNLNIRLAAPGEYYAIEESPFIDGIFLPNGAYGPVPVTKDGAIQWNAPRGELRQRVCCIRFDIRSFAGSKKGSRLSFTSESNAVGDLTVYGLLDESGDAWDENSISYLNAPGFHPTKDGQYALDPNVMERLGTISSTDKGVVVSDPGKLPLDSFLGRDTNGLVTFVLLSEAEGGSREWSIISKEGDLSKAPKLVFSGFAGQASVSVTTGQGQGADAYLNNDSKESAGNNYGRAAALFIRGFWKSNLSVSNENFITIQEGDSIQKQFFTVKGMAIGTYENPVVTFRRNTGITFDLKAIRESLPEKFALDSFMAMCGCPENLTNLNRAAVSGYEQSVRFYVLVDGQERFKTMGMDSTSSLEPIHIKLSENDRYLTLVEVGGGEASLFVSPRILFNEKEN